MSFDVFFQQFLDGDAGTDGGDRMREVLRPFIIKEESQHEFARVEYGDGTADVYLGQDHMMANHISGDAPWDLLVQGARAANWVIMPVGCPTCLTDDSQQSHLPEELSDDVAVVSSGADLLQVIRSA